jgi:hypothetical protein
MSKNAVTKAADITELKDLFNELKLVVEGGFGTDGDQIVAAFNKLMGMFKNDAELAGAIMELCVLSVLRPRKLIPKVARLIGFLESYVEGTFVYLDVKTNRKTLHGAMLQGVGAMIIHSFSGPGAGKYMVDLNKRGNPLTGTKTREALTEDGKAAHIKMVGRFAPSRAMIMSATQSALAIEVCNFLLRVMQNKEGGEAVA